MDYHSAAAYTSEKIAIYYTEKLIPSKQHLDENEFVQIERYSLEELNAMIFWWPDYRWKNHCRYYGISDVKT